MADDQNSLPFDRLFDGDPMENTRRIKRLESRVASLEVMMMQGKHPVPVAVGYCAFRSDHQLRGGRSRDGVGAQWERSGTSAYRDQRV